MQVCPCACQRWGRPIYVCCTRPTNELPEMQACETHVLQWLTELQIAMRIHTKSCYTHNFSLHTWNFLPIRYTHCLLQISTLCISDATFQSHSFKTFDPSSCIHHLLPPPRDTSVLLSMAHPGVKLLSHRWWSPILRSLKWAYPPAAIGIFTIGPLGQCPPPWTAKNLAYSQNATLEKLPQWKITKNVATRCQIWRQNAPNSMSAGLRPKAYSLQTS